MVESCSIGLHSGSQTYFNALQNTGPLKQSYFQGLLFCPASRPGGHPATLSPCREPDNLSSPPDPRGRHSSGDCGGQFHGSMHISEHEHHEEHKADPDRAVKVPVDRGIWKRRRDYSTGGRQPGHESKWNKATDDMGSMKTGQANQCSLLGAAGSASIICCTCSEFV
jgi:hypothetical protein